MVDMSPEAVTERLRLMGELWELSVRLMNSRKLTDAESDAFNHLDYRITDNNDLSFELLVDGKMIERMEESDVRSIPYWLFKGQDLPSFIHNFKQREWHVLGVCSCGEAGCGSAGCTLEKDEKVVTFREIFVDGFDFPDEYQIRFTRENYESVISRIVDEIEKFENSRNSNKNI
jgi:hypothetical protein